jgi:hypothetical protein
MIPADEFWGARVVLFYIPKPNANEDEILAEFESAFSKGLREIERPDKIIPVPSLTFTQIIFKCARIFCHLDHRCNGFCRKSRSS